MLNTSSFKIMTNESMTKIQRGDSSFTKKASIGDNEAEHKSRKHLLSVESSHQIGETQESRAKKSRFSTFANFLQIQGRTRTIDQKKRKESWTKRLHPRNSFPERVVRRSLLLGPIPPKVNSLTASPIPPKVNSCTASPIPKSIDFNPLCKVKETSKRHTLSEFLSVSSPSIHDSPQSSGLDEHDFYQRNSDKVYIINEISPQGARSSTKKNILSPAEEFAQRLSSIPRFTLAHCDDFSVATDIASSDYDGHHRARIQNESTTQQFLLSRALDLGKYQDISDNRFVANNSVQPVENDGASPAPSIQVFCHVKEENTEPVASSESWVFRNTTTDDNVSHLCSREHFVAAIDQENICASSDIQGGVKSDFLEHKTTQRTLQISELCDRSNMQHENCGSPLRLCSTDVNIVAEKCAKEVVTGNDTDQNQSSSVSHISQNDKYSSAALPTLPTDFEFDIENVPQSQEPLMHNLNTGVRNSDCRGRDETVVDSMLLNDNYDGVGYAYFSPTNEDQLCAKQDTELSDIESTDSPFENIGSRDTTLHSNISINATGWSDLIQEAYQLEEESMHFATEVCDQHVLEFDVEGHGDFDMEAGSASNMILVSTGSRSRNSSGEASEIASTICRDGDTCLHASQSSSDSLQEEYDQGLHCVRDTSNYMRQTTGQPIFQFASSTILEEACGEASENASTICRDGDTCLHASQSSSDSLQVECDQDLNCVQDTSNCKHQTNGQSDFQLAILQGSGSNLRNPNTDVSAFFIAESAEDPSYISIEADDNDIPFDFECDTNPKGSTYCGKYEGYENKLDTFVLPLPEQIRLKSSPQSVEVGKLLDESYQSTNDEELHKAKINKSDGTTITHAVDLFPVFISTPIEPDHDPLDYECKANPKGSTCSGKYKYEGYEKKLDTFVLPLPERIQLTSSPKLVGVGKLLDKSYQATCDEEIHKAELNKSDDGTTIAHAFDLLPDFISTPIEPDPDASSCPIVSEIQFHNAELECDIDIDIRSLSNDIVYPTVPVGTSWNTCKQSDAPLYMDDINLSIGNVLDEAITNNPIPELPKISAHCLVYNERKGMDTVDPNVVMASEQSPCTDQRSPCNSSLPQYPDTLDMQSRDNQSTKSTLTTIFTNEKSSRKVLEVVELFEAKKMQNIKEMSPNQRTEESKNISDGIVQNSLMQLPNNVIENPNASGKSTREYRQERRRSMIEASELSFPTTPIDDSVARRPSVSSSRLRVHRSSRMDLFILSPPKSDPPVNSSYKISLSESKGAFQAKSPQQQVINRDSLRAFNHINSENENDDFYSQDNCDCIQSDISAFPEELVQVELLNAFEKNESHLCKPGFDLLKSANSSNRVSSDIDVSVKIGNTVDDEKSLDLFNGNNKSNDENSKGTATTYEENESVTSSHGYTELIANSTLIASKEGAIQSQLSLGVDQGTDDLSEQLSIPCTAVLSHIDLEMLGIGESCAKVDDINGVLKDYRVTVLFDDELVKCAEKFSCIVEKEGTTGTLMEHSVFSDDKSIIEGIVVDVSDGFNCLGAVVAARETCKTVEELKKDFEELDQDKGSKISADIQSVVSESECVLNEINDASIEAVSETEAHNDIKTGMPIVCDSRQLDNSTICKNDSCEMQIDDTGDCQNEKIGNRSFTSNWKRTDIPRPRMEVIRETGQERHALLVDASQYVDCTYDSSLATFVVRSPFENVNDKESHWSNASKQGFDNWNDYSARVDLSKPVSLDVAVTFCDTGSVINIRDKDNVEFVDDIDSIRVASELFDDVCHQSMLVRQQYCSTLCLVSDAIHKGKGRLRLENVTGSQNLNESSGVISVSSTGRRVPVSGTRLAETNRFRVLAYTLTTKILSFFVYVIWFMFVQIPRAVVLKLLSLLFSLSWVMFVRIPVLLFLHTVTILLSILIAVSLRLYFTNQDTQHEIANFMMQNQPGIQ